MCSLSLCFTPRALHRLWEEKIAKSLPPAVGSLKHGKTPEKSKKKIGSGNSLPSLPEQGVDAPLEKPLDKPLEKPLDKPLASAELVASLGAQDTAAQHDTDTAIQTDSEETIATIATYKMILADDITSAGQVTTEESHLNVSQEHRTQEHRTQEHRTQEHRTQELRTQEHRTQETKRDRKNAVQSIPDISELASLSSTSTTLSTDERVQGRVVRRSAVDVSLASLTEFAELATPQTDLPVEPVVAQGRVERRKAVDIMGSTSMALFTPPLYDVSTHPSASWLRNRYR